MFIMVWLAKSTTDELLMSVGLAFIVTRGSFRLAVPKLRYRHVIKL